MTLEELTDLIEKEYLNCEEVEFPSIEEAVKIVASGLKYLRNKVDKESD